MSENNLMLYVDIPERYIVIEGHILLDMMCRTGLINKTNIGISFTL